MGEHRIGCASQGWHHLGDGPKACDCEADQIRADLEGEWFKAYYCVNCIPEDEKGG